MATSYLAPGVYVEEVPSGARPIEAVGTSTAAFVGAAPNGPSRRSGPGGRDRRHRPTPEP